MTIQLQIKKITVTKRNGLMDIVVLNTTLPDACQNIPNSKVKEAPALQLMFYATGGEGEEYCKKHFPEIEITVFDNY